MEENAQVPSAGLQPSGLTKEQVSAFVNDKALRQLKPGSAELTTAIENKLSNKPASPSVSDASKTEATTKTPDSKSGNNDPTETVDTDKAKLSAKAQKRIDSLTAARKAAEEERDNLRLELETERASKKAQVPAKQPATAERTPGPTFDVPKPKAQDFTNYADFTEALSDWKADQREHSKTVAAATADFEKKTKGAFEKFEASGSELEAELGLNPGDFHLTMQDEEFKLFNTTRAALLESEHGARIAYQIANNDDTKAAFSKMNDVQQLKHIGKLEAQIEAQAAKKETTKTPVSAAKAPAASLPRSSAPVTSTGMNFTPGMSVKDFEAARRASRAAAGKR